MPIANPNKTKKIKTRNESRQNETLYVVKHSNNNFV